MNTCAETHFGGECCRMPVFKYCLSMLWNSVCYARQGLVQVPIKHVITVDNADLLSGHGY